MAVVPNFRTPDAANKAGTRWLSEIQSWPGQYFYHVYPTTLPGNDAQPAYAEPKD